MNRSQIASMFFVFGWLWLPATSTGAHPYHVSLSEIELNSRSGNFEVAVCLWPADIERALSIQEKAPVDLDKTSNLDVLLKSYVDKRFKIFVGETQITTIRWVGQESNNKRIWVYFELIPPENSNIQQGIKIENRLLFELNEDQVNQVNFKINQKLQSFSCDRRKWQIKIAGASPTP